MVGICSENVWNMCGTCLEYVWNIWNMIGICWEYFEYVWNILGICLELEYVWIRTCLEYVWNVLNMLGIRLEYVWNMQFEHHSLFEFVWKAVVRKSSRSSCRKRISICWEVARKLIFSAVSSQSPCQLSCGHPEISQPCKRTTTQKHHIQAGS